MMRSGGDGVNPTDQWTGMEQNRDCRAHACVFCRVHLRCVPPFDPRRVYSYIVGRLRSGGAPLRLMVQALIPPRRPPIRCCLRVGMSAAPHWPPTKQNEASAGTGNWENKTRACRATALPIWIAWPRWLAGDVVTPLSAHPVGTTKKLPRQELPAHKHLPVLHREPSQMQSLRADR